MRDRTSSSRSWEATARRCSRRRMPRKRRPYARPLPRGRRASRRSRSTPTRTASSGSGARVRFDRFGWTLVVEQPYDDAFAPVVSTIREQMLLNLGIVLGFSLVAFQVARSIVRPILALSDAALRIATGETDVMVGGSPAADEIGVLTRAFNEMSSRLRRNQLALEESRLEVEDANCAADRAEQRAAARERGLPAALDHGRSDQAAQPPLLPRASAAGDEARGAHRRAARPDRDRSRRLQAPERPLRTRRRRRRAEAGGGRDERRGARDGPARALRRRGVRVARQPDDARGRGRARREAAPRDLARALLGDATATVRSRSR